MSNSFLKISRTFCRSRLLARYSSSQFNNVQLETKEKEPQKDDTSTVSLQAAALNPLTDGTNKLVLRGDINAVFMNKSSYRVNLDVKFRLHKDIRCTMYVIMYQNENFGKDLGALMTSLRVGDNVTIEAVLSLSPTKHVTLEGSYIEKHKR